MLRPDEVRVWRATVADAGAHLTALLDGPEQQRLGAYRRAVDQTRFLIGAALVRLVAGRHLGLAPASVPVRRRCPDCPRPHGRVELPGGEVRLSVSHSGDLVVVAAHVGADVGVDVEELSRAWVEPATVARILAPAEAAALAGLSPAGRGRSLLGSWTVKEALLKMTGDGLRVPPAQLVLSGDRSLLAWPGRPELPGRVRVYDLPVGPTHLGAVAVHRPEPVAVRVVDAAPLLAP